jgi:hypothetical protein
MLLGISTETLSPAIALSGDGTGAGIVGTLGTGWTDGTPIACSGMTNIEVPVVVGVYSGHTVTVRLVHRTTAGDFVVPVTVDGSAMVTSMPFTAASRFAASHAARCWASCAAAAA